ncbi:uncharacterized protein LOC133741387 [Rosa rugosa]|uniref:uncharacterized protein LOC133741387 n=1 Tax=Rosa rugosa TaxID=74645 RepID=UPI002B40083B|nr:uncharacterized protein LOC133741387 [Rosa rugosa]
MFVLIHWSDLVPLSPCSCLKLLLPFEFGISAYGLLNRSDRCRKGRDYLPMDKRYPRLFIPSEFCKLQMGYASYPQKSTGGISIHSEEEERCKCRIDLVINGNDGIKVASVAV